MIYITYVKTLFYGKVILNEEIDRIKHLIEPRNLPLS